MQDRLGNFLSSGQSVLVTNGYSFVDQHLNEIIVQKLSANPRAVCFGLLYGDLEDYPEARESARKTTNLILIAQDAAFIGREKRIWQIQDGADTQQYNCCIEVSKTESSEEQQILCQLGNFNGLGKFLLNQTSSAHKED